MAKRFLLVTLLGLALLACGAWAQAPAPDPANASAAAAAAPVASADETAVPVPVKMPATGQRMTLMDMVYAGGAILWIIMAMGFAALTWAVYLFLTLTVGREAPSTLAKRTFAQVRAGDLRGAYQMCQDGNELLANVFCAGLRMTGHDRYVLQEAMESEGQRGSAVLWQRITYLQNMATIGPLLGLLGTVWGMMEAFGSIAYETAEVKSMAMAPSIAKAMITTAGGLILAIPASSAYYILRGRVLKITSTVEAYATEFLELLTQPREE